MVHTCLVSAKDKTEQSHGTAAFWPRQNKSKIKFKQLPNSFGVWSFGFFSKSSAEANLHNYLLHCGFSDIKLLPIYLRSNSSSESWKHSSCHPLKPFHNRYLTVYNHKLMGVQTSSFPLFVLPGVAISWGQLMLNTRMYRTPQTHQQTVSVCHWEKEQIPDRSQQESLPPTELWMVPHCQTGLRHWERMHQPGVGLRAAACTWKYLPVLTSIQVWLPEHLHHSECSQRGCWLSLHSNPFLQLVPCSLLVLVWSTGSLTPELTFFSKD